MPPEPEKKEPENLGLKQIRTFQGDVAEALKNQQASLVSIQRAEHAKKGAIPQEVSKISQRRRSLFMLSLGSLVLIAFGTVGTWYAYNEFIRKSATPITAAPPNRLISSEDEVQFHVTAKTREEFITALRESSIEASKGVIQHIILTKEGEEGQPSRPFETDEFFAALNTRAPGSLVRAFDPLFMFGTFGESTFLIIKLDSFENAFAGMLAWEKNMAADIGPILVTAPILRDIPLESVFIDITDRNKDIRELVVSDRPALMYSFFDNNMLIITDQLETMRTVIDRLNREKLSR